MYLYECKMIQLISCYCYTKYCRNNIDMKHTIVSKVHVDG